VTSTPLDLRVERLLRDLTPQVLGALVRRFRDFAASEDAVQEALIAAAAQWPRDGIPDNPRGWLIQVALRRMTDHVRSEISRRRREAVAADEMPMVGASALSSEPEIDPDDTLLLLFMCCHPALLVKDGDRDMSIRDRQQYKPRLTPGFGERVGRPSGGASARTPRVGRDATSRMR
jgi:predicted RNA polymerase sigma factor